MRDLALKKVVGKTVEVEGIGEVHITKAGIKKCLAQSTPHEFYNKKNSGLTDKICLLKNIHKIYAKYWQTFPFFNNKKIISHKWSCYKEQSRI